MTNEIDNSPDDDFDDDSPSHSSVTAKLAIIQKRCAELLDDADTDDFGGLSIADDEELDVKSDEPSPYDPYGR